MAAKASLTGRPSCLSAGDLLDRISKEQLDHLSADVHKFLLPVFSLQDADKENRPAAGNMRDVAKKFTPFLSKLLRGCVNSLAVGPGAEQDSAKSPSVDDAKFKELLEIGILCLKGLDILREFLKGRTYEVEIHQYNFVRKLLIWKRHKDCLIQGWELYRNLCKLLQQNPHCIFDSCEIVPSNLNSGGKTAEKQDVFTKEATILTLPPPPNPGKSDGDFVLLLVGACLNIIVSTAECGSEEETELYLAKLIQLPRQLELWLSELESDTECKHRDSLFRGLYKCALKQIAEASSSAKENVLELIRLTLSACTISASANCFAQVTRSLVDQVNRNVAWKDHELFRHVFDIAVHELLSMVKNDQNPLHEKQVLELVAAYAKSILHSNKGLGSQLLWQLLPPISQAIGEQTSAFAGLYAAALDLQAMANNLDQTEECEDKQCSTDVPDEVESAHVKAAMYGKLEKIRTSFIRLLETAREEQDVGIAGSANRANVKAGAESLDFFRKVASKYADSSWRQYLGAKLDNKSKGSRPKRIVLAELRRGGYNTQVVEILKLAWPLVEAASMRNADADENDSSSLQSLTAPAVSGTMAALRLSVSNRSEVEGLTGLVLQIVKSDLPQADDVKWLMLSISHMGVQLFNLKRYSEAVEPLELAYQAAFVRASAIFPATRQPLEEGMDRWSADEVNLLLQLSSKCVTLVDCLRRLGEASQAMRKAEQFLKRWGWAAEILDQDGPRVLVRQWLKIKTSHNLGSDKEFPCQLWHVLKKADPKLSDSALGALLEEEIMTYESVEPEQMAACMAAKSAVLNAVLSEVYTAASNPVRRALMLLEHGRVARILPGGSVTSSLEVVQEAVELLEKCMSKKSSNTFAKGEWRKLEDCCATAHCIRALCLREAHPESKVFMIDINRAISLWQSIFGWNDVVPLSVSKKKSPEEKKMLLQRVHSVSTSVNLLMAVADLMALENQASTQQQAHYLAISLAALADNEQLALSHIRLLADARLSHILCPVPCMTLGLLGSSDETEDTAQHLEDLQLSAHNVSPGSLLDAWLLLFKGSVSGTWHSSQKVNLPDSWGTSADRAVQEMRLSCAAHPRRTVQVLVRDGGLNYLLASRALEFGLVDKALQYSTDALKLRFTVFSYMFSEKDEPPPEFKEESPQPPKVPSLSATGDGLKSTWPSLKVSQLEDAINEGGVISNQWRILGDYLESLFQIGTVSELSGLVDEAEKHFKAGHRIATALEFVHLQASFASALGETHRKQHKWVAAEKVFETAASALQRLQNLHVLGQCHPCWSICQADLHRRMGDLARRRNDILPKNHEEDCHSAKLSNLKSAQGAALPNNKAATSERKETMNDAGFKMGASDNKAVVVALKHYAAAESFLALLLPDHAGVAQVQLSAAKQEEPGQSPTVTQDSSVTEEGEKQGKRALVSKSKGSKRGKAQGMSQNDTRPRSGSNVEEKTHSGLSYAEGQSRADVEVDSSEVFNGTGRKIRTRRRVQKVIKTDKVKENGVMQLATTKAVNVAFTASCETGSGISHRDKNDTTLKGFSVEECTCAELDQSVTSELKSQLSLDQFIEGTFHDEVRRKWALSIWRSCAEGKLARLLVQQGKCYVSIGHLQTAEECFDLAGKTVQHSSGSPETYGIPLDQEANYPRHPIEEAALLLNKSRLKLRRRCREGSTMAGMHHSDVLRNCQTNAVEDLGKIFDWLHRAFKLCLHVPILLMEIASLLAILYSAPVGSKWLQSILPSNKGPWATAALFHGVSVGMTSLQQHITVMESKLQSQPKKNMKLSQQEEQSLSDSNSEAAKLYYKDMLEALRLVSTAIDSPNLEDFFNCHVASKLPAGLTLCCITAVDLGKAGLLPAPELDPEAEPEVTESSCLLISRIANGRMPVVLLLPSTIDNSKDGDNDFSDDDLSDVSSVCNSSGFATPTKSTPIIYLLSSDSDEEGSGIEQQITRGMKGGERKASDAYQNFSGEQPLGVKKLVSEFLAIMHESEKSTSSNQKMETKEEKAAWWKWRLNLDLRLESLLRNIEERWLGAWKCLLLPEPADVFEAAELQARSRALTSLMMVKAGEVVGHKEEIASMRPTQFDEEIVRLLVLGAGSISDEQLRDAIIQILDRMTAAIYRQSQEEENAAYKMVSVRRNVKEELEGKFQNLVQKKSVQELVEAFLVTYAKASWRKEPEGDNSSKGEVVEETPRVARGRRRAKAKRDGALAPDPEPEGHLNKQATGHSKRHALELLLDGNLQVLPWENIPSLRGGRIYRMPSIPSVLALLAHSRHTKADRFAELPADLPSGSRFRSVLGDVPDMQCRSEELERGGNSWERVPAAIDPQKAFYLLNPSGDLVATQAAFQEWFAAQQGWQGTVGQVPSAEDFSSALQNHDLFVYCGHGSGEQFFPAKSLRKLSKCAAAFLMGCSSGKLSLRGDYEPVGIPLAYFMAGCPASVANLWDVTDGDIDRFSRAVLEEWLSKRSVLQEGSSISDSTSESEGKGGQSLGDGERVVTRYRRKRDPSVPVSGRIGGESHPPIDTSGARTHNLGGRSDRSLKIADTSLCGRRGPGYGAASAAKVPPFEACLSTAIIGGRRACRLRHLIGSAPVCYGIPAMLLKDAPCEKSLGQ